MVTGFMNMTREQRTSTASSVFRFEFNHHLWHAVKQRIWGTNYYVMQLFQHGSDECLQCLVDCVTLIVQVVLRANRCPTQTSVATTGLNFHLWPAFLSLYQCRSKEQCNLMPKPSDVVQLFYSYCLGNWVFNAHAFFDRICKKDFRSTKDSLIAPCAL